jgi:hypothetical protein
MGSSSSSSSGPGAYAPDAPQPVGLLCDPCPTSKLFHINYTKSPITLSLTSPHRTTPFGLIARFLVKLKNELCQLLYLPSSPSTNQHIIKHGRLFSPWQNTLERSRALDLYLHINTHQLPIFSILTKYLLPVKTTRPIVDVSRLNQYGRYGACNYPPWF